MSALKIAFQWTERALPVAFVLVLVAAPFASAHDEAKQESKPAAKASSSLDDELLRGLGDDPFEKEASKDSAAKPAAKPESGPAKPAAKTARPASTDPLDEELLRGLDAVEGGDAAEQGDPLVRLNRRMREAQARLRALKSDDTTQQLQDKIVRELEELIQQCQKQQQQQQQQASSSSGSGSEQTAGRERVNQPQMAKSSAAAKPARDSSDRQGKPEVRKPDMAKMRDLLKDIWGELPPRLRQQMMQSSVERFVPKYELLIEEYFQTLAERQQNSK